MRYAYLQSARRENWKSVLRGLIPVGILHLRNLIRYRKWFPHACISPDSIISAQALVGRNTIITKALVGAGVSLGDFTTVGVGSCLTGAGKIEIGSFCSIGPNCYMRSDNHEIRQATTYPLEQMLAGKTERWNEFPAKDIRIGHDVWIGQGVTVLAGACIGHGCVLAAGCVVPARVFPPYSIVGGVPGKVLKSRFPGKTVGEMLKDPWWDKGEEEIFGPLMERLHSRPEPGE